MTDVDRIMALIDENYICDQHGGGLKVRTAIEQALSARVPKGWQPIETAPRDGQNILLRFGRDGISQGKYVPGLPYPWQFIDTNNGISWLINRAVDAPGGPSHWMPLPDDAPQPPAQEVPEGWKLVPVEPTYEMLTADWNVSLSDAHTETGVAECAYAAMLNAAPQPPAQEVRVHTAPCKGMNCGATDGVSHSLECQAEHAAAIAGGVFTKDAPQPPAQEAHSKWDGSEGWESLAWELCADENGEEACSELIWEGGPIPEPWGDRWMKYEDEAKRLIALVQKHVPAPQPPAQREPVADPIAVADTNALLSGTFRVADPRRMILKGTKFYSEHTVLELQSFVKAARQDRDNWKAHYYTAPQPQREWVGLQAADWNSIAYSGEFRAGAEWAEAKLRERNGGAA